MRSESRGKVAVATFPSSPDGVEATSLAKEVKFLYLRLKHNNSGSSNIKENPAYFMKQCAVNQNSKLKLNCYNSRARYHISLGEF